MIVNLVFNNADATPKTVAVQVHIDAVPDIMAWYGAYFAGDRYTTAMNGRNVRMDLNGEPSEWKADLSALRPVTATTANPSEVQ